MGRRGGAGGQRGSKQRRPLRVSLTFWENLSNSLAWRTLKRGPRPQVPRAKSLWQTHGPTRSAHQSPVSFRFPRTQTQRPYGPPQTHPDPCRWYPSDCPARCKPLTPKTDTRVWRVLLRGLALSRVQLPPWPQPPPWLRLPPDPHSGPSELLPPGPLTAGPPSYSRPSSSFNFRVGAPLFCLR